jgi:hypothetical protein
MSLCPEVEAELVAHTRGELDPLRRARVEAHVAHCVCCRSTEAALRRDLGAARAWDPSLEPAELARLTRRVVPTLPARGRAPWAAGALALAAAAGAVVVLGVRAPPADEVAVTSPLPALVEPAAGHGPAVSPVSGAMSLAIAPTVDPPARAARWGAGVRAVTSDDWSARLLRREGVVELEAVRGFAVITVEPGHSPLLLRAPDVVVQSGEGRVFVEVLPGQPTRVQLLGGRAELVREGRRETLAVAPGAAPEASAQGLLEATAGSAARTSAAPPGRPGAPRSARTPAVRGPVDAPAVARAIHPSAEALARVLEAEALVQGGQRDQAERVLAEGARVVEGARARDLLRWEHARLVAHDPARRAEALRLLAALATEGHGEAAVQAAALRCQLMSTQERPEACLEGLQPGSAAVDEARRVLRRSQLMKERSGS